MARYDKHQDLEFEFILNSDISIVSEMGKKILKVDYNTNIIAYQNWSIKTKSLNNGERAVFNYSCDKLIKAVARLKNMDKSYEPSVIMSYKNSSDESIHLVFSAENLRYNEDKRDNKLYMLMDVTDKLHSDLIPEDGDFQDVRLNLSTMPYHVLDVKVGSLPRSNNNVEVHSSNDNYEIPPFSFLVDTTVSSISTVNGVSQIRLPSSSVLYAYEQWSVNHKALEGRKRILKAMTWEEAKENVGEYDSKFQNSAFTPTVFIEINEKQYLGVITGLEIEGSDAVLSVETKSMAMKNDGQSSSMPSLPESLEEGTKIFMNIDDTPSVNNISLIQNSSFEQTQDIQHNEILTIDSSNRDLGENKLDIQSNIFHVYGKLNIIVEKSDLLMTQSAKLPYITNIQPVIMNYGEICIFIRDSNTNDINFNIDGISGILNGGVYNMEDANIVVSGLIPNYTSDGSYMVSGKPGDNEVLEGDHTSLTAKYRTYRRRIQISGGEDDYYNGDQFYFLNTVDNLGSIYFNPIINNSFHTVVGINMVRTCGMTKTDINKNIGYTKEFIDDLPAYPRMPYVNKGTIYFDILQSSAEFSVVNNQERNWQNVTIGIGQIQSLSYGNIVFGALRSGKFDVSGQDVVCLQNGVRTTMEDSLVAGGYQQAEDGCQMGDARIVSNDGMPNNINYGNGIENPDNFDSKTIETMEKNRQFNLKQSVIGILNAGDVDDTIEDAYGRSYTGLNTLDVDIARINYRLTNPNYDYYGYGSWGTHPEEKKSTSHICGVGNRGKIIIGVIQNNSFVTNPTYPDLEIPNACGVYKLIQVHESANTYINEVVNFAYGGKNACMGICNLLVNYGQVQIYQVSNLTITKYDSTDDAQCSGIFRVIQNGYTEILDDENLSKKDRASLQRACLPPFPPAYYDTNGEPNKTELTYDPIKIVNQIFTSYGKKYSGSRLSDFWRSISDQGKSIDIKYKQGHISIDRVVTQSGMNCNSVGINEYGGSSIHPEIMSRYDDAPFTRPLSIEAPMKDYVKKNAELSAVWAYPTTKNTQWDSSGYSELLEYVFPPDAQGNHLTIDAFLEAIKKTGWYWNWDNPVQMYYQYIENTEEGLLSDIIYFPINWGIVTINHVLSGQTPNNAVVEFTYHQPIKGSAMGIQKLVTAMGPVQIVNIESNIGVEPEPAFGKKIETEEFTKTNTEELPELTREFFSDESRSYIDLPQKYAHGFNLTHANNVSLETLPIKLSINSADIADPENRFDGIWTTGTQGYNNYCWPYSLVSKADLADSAPEPANLRSSSDDDFHNEFNLLGFTPPSESSASNLLEFLMSPGAAFGVFRTVDYGSESPGLSFLKSWTTPIDTRPHIGDVWNNAQECMGEVKAWESIYTDCALDSCFGNPTPDSIRLNVKQISVKSPAIYKNKLTPISEDLLEKTANLHYDIVRSPVSGIMSDGDTVEPGWSSNYLRYPLRPRTTFNYYDIGNASRLDGEDTFMLKALYGNSPGNQPKGLPLAYSNGTRVIPPIYPMYNWTLTSEATMSVLTRWFGADFTGDKLGEVGVRREGHSDELYRLNSDYINKPGNNWIGVWVSVFDTVTGTTIDRLLNTEDSTKQFTDLIEKPVKMQSITHFHGKDISNQFVFDAADFRGSHSGYIYNNELLNSLIDSDFYKKIKDENNIVTPDRDNYFNGLTPFPSKLTNLKLVNPYQNLTFANRTFQDYIPLSEKLIWNPSAYHISNPYAYIYPKQGTRGSSVAFYGDTNRYILPITDNNGGDYNRANTHDNYLRKIYPFLKEDATFNFVSFPDEVLNGTASMPSHFNILHSKWPYDEALKQLNDKYFGLNDDNLFGSGRSGPLNSTYYSPSDSRVIKMRNHPFSSLGNFLSYNYSSTRPIGFNPQLIRGGYWNLDSNHKNINSINNGNYGLGDQNQLPGFSVISKGKKYIDSLFSFEKEKYVFPYFVNENRLTHDDNYRNSKYKTNNRYYGFVYENRNSLVKMKYKAFESVEGPYSRYKNILNLVSDQIYIEGENETEYTQSIANNLRENYNSAKQEQQARTERQTSGLWGLAENALLIGSLTLML